MAGWKTLSSKNVYSNPWYSVREDKVLDHRDKQLTYSVIDLANPAVFIVALNDRNEFFMQKQYRYTINKEVWSLPAGHSDGQDLLVAAQRELSEEAGYGSDKWTDLGKLFSAVGIANIPMKVFLAENIYKQAIETDEEEDISESRFIGLEEFRKEVSEGKIQEAAVIAAISLADNYLDERKK